MVKRPILWELSQKHNLTYSIRAASLGTDGGIIQIELIGPNTKISNAIADFKNTDVVITDIDDFQLDA